MPRFMQRLQIQARSGRSRNSIKACTPLSGISQELWSSQRLCGVEPTSTQSDVHSTSLCVFHLLGIIRMTSLRFLLPVQKFLPALRIPFIRLTLQQHLPENVT